MARPTGWDILGLDGDPTPGVVESVEALAKEFGDFAHDVESAYRSLNSFGGDASALQWIGQTADAFKSSFGPLPGRLQKLYTSYSEASDALSAYAPKLSAAQNKADAALRQAQDAQADLQRATITATNAAADLKTAQQSQTAAPNPKVVTDAQTAHDTAQKGLDAAKGKLTALTAQAKQAYDDRIAAAKECAKALHHAQSDGIHNKHWWQHVGEALSEWGGKIAEIANDLAPALDVLALATSWIPGVDVVTAGLAEADNLIALAGTGMEIAGDGMQGHWGDALMGAGMLGAQFLGGRALGALGGKVLGKLGSEAEEDSVATVSDEVRGGVADVVPVTDPGALNAFKAGYGNYANDLDFANNLVANDPRFAGMDPQSLTAVRGYTSNDFYGPMNAALRSGDPAELAKWDAHIKVTDAGLAQLPDFAGEVQRGTTLPAAVLDSIQPGSTTTFNEFLSTSTNSPFPGNTHFTISSLTGKDVAPLSHMPWEAEVLFRPGSTFDVVSKVQDATGTWHIHLSEVPK